ncbi:MAG: glycosyltransferase, partial [Isosphaeraceae bacterium]|nr:glycosyltransferase [Isosphaeraceae bacterium]
STDRTGNIILDHCETNPSIKLVRLGSNCGSHVACRAGLEHCSGDVAIFLTADLQEGPDLVPRVIEKWREGAEVVCSIAQSRDRGSLLSNAAAWLYYYLVGRFDRLKHLEDRRAIPRLLSRKAIHHYCQYAPRNHNMTVWLLQQRFPLGYVSYTPLARKHGSSKWTLRKRIQLAVNTFLDITPAFLTGWLFLGMAMVLLGLLAMVGSGLHALLTSRLANAHLAFGISGVVALSTGLILMAMGLLGTYLWRIYDELRNGPEYTVQRLANIASCLTPDQPPVRPG